MSNRKGIGGRKRIPREIKMRQGTYRKDRDIPEHQRLQFELITEYPEPPFPDAMDKESLRIWKVATAFLIELKMLQVPDVHLLQIYCIEAAHLKDLQRIIKKEGAFIKNSKGENKPHPALKMQKTALKSVLSLASLFGFTPRARQMIREFADAKKEFRGFGSDWEY